MTEKSLHRPSSEPFHAFAVVIRLGILVEGLRVAEVEFKKIFNLVRGVFFSWRVAFGRRSGGRRPITGVGSIAVPPRWVLGLSIATRSTITPTSRLHTDTVTTCGVSA